MTHLHIHVVFLILLVVSPSSGQTIGLNNIMERLHFLHKDGKQTGPRKLLDVEMMQLDYDYAGPNPKHDPRKGKGGSSRNP